MTIPEAAASLGLAESTLRWQVRNGQLRAIKHGRDWWVAPAEVERYRSVSLGRVGRRSRDPLAGDALELEGVAVEAVKVNGDEVVVRQGDTVVTLEERLAAMQRSIRRLGLVLVVMIVLQVLWAVLGPEEFARIVRQFLDVAV